MLVNAMRFSKNLKRDTFSRMKTNNQSVTLEALFVLIKNVVPILLKVDHNLGCLCFHPFASP